MQQVYLGLGSNQGKREEFLSRAVREIGASGWARLVMISPIYRTEPVGFAGQEVFLNLAVEIVTELAPENLAGELQAIERRVGRKADFKNGPREIDIDILLYGDEVVETPQLRIPHPGLNKREFALRPLLDLNPELVEPSTNLPYSVYLNRIAGGKAVAKVAEFDPQTWLE